MPGEAEIVYQIVGNILANITDPEVHSKCEFSYARSKCKFIYALTARGW